MRGWMGLMLAISTGCGDDDCCTMTRIDAPSIDSPAIDALMLPGTSHHYVIDRELVPQTNTQARDLGLDLNGDGTVDNQLGMVISTLAGMGLGTQVTLDRAIDTGTALMLVDVRADDLALSGPAAFTLYTGANPMPAPCADAQDTVCRKHLAGTGSFTVDPAAPKDPLLLGSTTAGSSGARLTAGPGHLTIQLTMTDVTPITATLLGARVDVVVDSSTASGKLGGAISMSDINTKIVPAMRNSFQAQVLKDCTMLQSPPACGCAQDSEGKTLLGLFDTTPKDCSISVQEVQNNSLIVSLLAPDVMVENTMALSIGVGMHAVPATFTAP